MASTLPMAAVCTTLCVYVARLISCPDIHPEQVRRPYLNWLAALTWLLSNRMIGWYVVQLAIVRSPTDSLQGVCRLLRAVVAR